MSVYQRVMISSRDIIGYLHDILSDRLDLQDLFSTSFRSSKERKMEKEQKKGNLHDPVVLPLDMIILDMC